MEGVEELYVSLAQHSCLPNFITFHIPADYPSRKIKWSAMPEEILK